MTLLWKNTNLNFKLTQMYQYIQYFENLIRILLDLFIIMNDWMKIVSLMLPADLKNMDSRKNRHSQHFEKKITKKVCIPFKICRIKAVDQILFLKNFFKLQTWEKARKKPLIFSFATVVLSLKLPIQGLVITIQYGNIVTLVTRSSRWKSRPESRKDCKKDYGIGSYARLL